MITKAALLPFFKLEKLRIETYRTRDRNLVDKDPEDFEAMFNPESFSQTITNNLTKQAGFGSSSDEIGFGSTAPRKLRFKLIIDHTDVSGSFYLLTLNDRIEKFIDKAVYMNGQIHEPRFLRVKWGTYSLDCRIESLDVKYTLFDRGGNALRAELDIAFVEDISEIKRQRELKLSSPDLTHVKVVKKGDTLSMMSKEIYGSAGYYIQVARHNKLNDFRKLQPGMELHFPPIEK